MLKLNLTMLGPPGSGKGYYGKRLANLWKVPLWTASTILRKQRPNEIGTLESGKLIDCEVVSEAIQEFLHEQQQQQQQQPLQTSGRIPTTPHGNSQGIRRSYYLLDGFPRTRRQCELQEKSWSKGHKIHAAIKLDIPDHVCVSKIMGRRHCPVCKQDFNIANVQEGDFDLPPQVPSSCDKCNLEDTDQHWIRRPDDVEQSIVSERLRTYRTHEEPIVDYFQSKGRLLKLVPYRGEADIPLLQKQIHSWMDAIVEEESSNNNYSTF